MDILFFDNKFLNCRFSLSFCRNKIIIADKPETTTGTVLSPRLHAHSQISQTFNNNNNRILLFLLGREVKVESRLEPVKLELTWREEVSWRRSGLERECLLDWLSWLLEARLLNWSSHLLNSCLVTS